MISSQQRQNGLAQMSLPVFGTGLDIAEPVVCGSLDVDNSFWSGNDLHLVHRYADIPAIAGDWNWNIYFAVRGMTGRNPLFRWETGDNTTMLWGTRYCTPKFSYNNRDWTTFANISRSFESYVRFSHSSPFTNDLVYVWVQPPKDYREFGDWLRNTVFRSTYVTATASELYPGSRIIDWTEARTVVDSTCGLARPAQPVRGFLMKWVASPTRLGILTSALHGCGEAGSRWTLRGALDYLLTSSDAEAVAVRAAWAFLVYPQLNPLGEVCGSNRGWGGDMTVDTNRVWNLVDTGIPVYNRFRTKIQADVAAVGLPVSLTCDFHSHNPEEASNAHYCYIRTGETSEDFKDLWAVRDATCDELGTLSAASWLDGWYRTTFSPTCALIHEASSESSAATNISRGETFVKVISDAMDAEWL